MRHRRRRANVADGPGALLGELSKLLDARVVRAFPPEESVLLRLHGRLHGVSLQHGRRAVRAQIHVFLLGHHVLRVDADEPQLLHSGHGQRRPLHVQRRVGDGSG